jgi:hypothetical protein
VLLLVLLGGGYVFAPIALPLMEPADLEVYMQERGIAPKAQEVGHHTVLPQYFSDRFGWEELARAVSTVYEELPEADRAACYAFAGNYGQAGALEYWSQRYDLPPVFSAHNNYWLWGPPPAGGDVVVVVDFRRETLETFFDRVTLAEELRTPHAQEDYIAVWVCRVLKRPIDELWAEFKHFI